MENIDFQLIAAHCITRVQVSKSRVSS